jgi:hypothetical protein
MAGPAICVSCASLPIKDREAATRTLRCPQCRARLGFTSYGACFRLDAAANTLLTAGVTRNLMIGAVVGASLFVIAGVVLWQRDSSVGVNPPEVAARNGVIELKLKRHSVVLSDPSVPAELKRVPEVSLVDFPEGMTPGAARQKQTGLMAQIRQENQVKQDGFLLAQIERRPELRGLPYIMGDDCKLDFARRADFQQSVLLVRTAVDWYAKDPAEFFLQPGVHGQTDASLAALAQILGPESESLRSALAHHLMTSNNQAASKILAKAAIFDAGADVRIAAIKALRKRRAEEYTDILMQGLRYPLPAVANRAAFAIIDLKRTEMLPQVADVLGETPPSDPAPAVVDQVAVHVVREVVKINHHRNCYLCHAPAGGVNSQVEGTVPSLGEAFPRSTREYYGAGSDLAVRADTTYLRQDFSVMLPVANAAPWPSKQRFDFLVRSRVVEGKELAEMQAAIADRPANFLSANQQAALQVLRELTGQDAQPNPAAWHRIIGDNR